MESPVVVDKPPEYHGNNDRGFPFDEEEGSGAWSELAARHPDIAARLRQRPATWARKRRPSSQDATDDFGDNFGGFDRFPFDDIPAEFREHFPSHWSRRYSGRDEPPEPGRPEPAPHAPPAPQQHSAATQTERPEPAPPQERLPQYGLRNTVDLGQSSPADPSVDADERAQRSVSAPPDAPRPASPVSPASPAMSANQPEEQSSNVRHIPIFVEGRDEPVLNRNVDAHYETKPPPPHAPHVDRDQYFADDAPGFHHPPNFTRAFGTPFNKGFRQGPQPFTQQKAYPQSAFPRATSPKPPEEQFVKVPAQPEPGRAPRPPPERPSPQRQTPQRQTPQRDRTPPPKQPSPNDPITLILSIQTDVLNLMTEVENFKGTKRDKRYMFLDEMLTRNLIKLDNIETEGKENIRQARKEAIKCIQKCIAVLEAKAESQSGAAAPRESDMDTTEAPEPELVTENGEVEMKETLSQPERLEETQPKEEIQEAKRETTPKPHDKTQHTPLVPPVNAETQPVEDAQSEKADEQKSEIEDKPSPNKKVVKKRDKSKDKDSNTEASKDSNKVAEGEKVETMQVEGGKSMEVDGAASQ